MLEAITGLPSGVKGMKATGKVSKEEYERVFKPILTELQSRERPLRLLYQLGPEFEGYSPLGVLEDMKLGVQSWPWLAGCAIVTDVSWVRHAAELIGFLVPYPVRVFSLDQQSQASAWLGTLPEGPEAVHRMLGDRGVLVVDIHEALRSQDFDALERTADGWIETHGSLQGLVVHTREFPGWENLGSLLRHVRFVREHHRKVKRIAIAADSKLASIAPVLAELFVKAELKSFSYDALEQAIAWAGGATEEAKASSGDGAQHARA
jgi:hypothetical protein